MTCAASTANGAVLQVVRPRAGTGTSVERMGFGGAAIGGAR